MGDWIPKDKFKETEYGILNEKLNPSKYYGSLIPEKLPTGSSIVTDPKDGLYGIIKDSDGVPIGKVKIKP